MYFTFEISRPMQLKPWFFRSCLTIRFGWLWFALGYYQMREDELHEMATRGMTKWGGL